MALSTFDFKQDCFDLFGLPRVFMIDLPALETRYRELQGIYHPDRHADLGARERRLAVQISARINEAHETLRLPARRARYLLELAGVLFNDERDTTGDPDFLMRQMAIREAIDEAGSGPEPLTELDRLATVLRNDRDQLYARFQTEYEVSRLNDAKHTVLQMSFYTRLLEEIDHLVERLEDQHV